MERHISALNACDETNKNKDHMIRQTRTKETATGVVVSFVHVYRALKGHVTKQTRTKETATGVIVSFVHVYWALNDHVLVLKVFYMSQIRSDKPSESVASFTIADMPVRAW
jgi:hypothetical protein